MLDPACLTPLLLLLVVGHASKLSFGRLAGVPVVAQAGRYHLYEGKALNLVTYPIRVFGALGAKAVIRESDHVNAPPFGRARYTH